MAEFFRYLTWTCHICGDERPDAVIDVIKHTHQVGWIKMQENVRFCNDRQACREAALTYCFTGKAEEHV